MNAVRSFYDALNKNDLNEMMKPVHDQVEFVDYASGNTIRGKEGVTNYFKGWMDAFPDGRGNITNLVTSGDQIVVEVTARGTHQGDFQSPEGILPPTGNTVEVRFCQVFRIKGGKIVAGHSYYDLAGMMKAMSVVPIKKTA